MLKLSFILPCYNVEQYIGRCLDSILNQDIPHNEYEIICVNDCSPDNLRDVIIEYQQKYPNIVLIEHTENKTAGGARNTGIEYARGKYIWFVDPDDQIMPNSLQKLWDEVNDNNLDILFFNNNKFTYEGECKEYKVVPNSDILSGQEFLKKYFPHKTTKICSVCNELMRTDFIASSGIRYPEIAASQDIVFLWEVICNAQKVKSIDSIHYSVYRRKQSTTGIKGRCTARTCFSFSVLYSICQLLMIERNNISQIIKEDICIDIYRSVNDDSRILYYLSYSEKKKFYQKLKSHKQDIKLLMPYMNTTTKRLFKGYGNFILWYAVVFIHALRYQVKQCKLFH